MKENTNQQSLIFRTLRSERRKSRKDTGRSSGFCFQHICMISRRRGGQSLGIFGVNFLSLHQKKQHNTTQHKKENEKQKQQTLTKIHLLYF
jgi:hypothetical protein